jgi:hypothetical protein
MDEGGYMQTRVACFVICVFISTTVFSIEVLKDVNAQPVIEWEKTYGGNFEDWGNQIIQTYDNGYILVGNTNSFGAGDFDAWLIKTDELGNNQWMKTYGGSFDDKGGCINHTSDGGYIIAGTTCSYGAGEDDIWLVKIDALGNEQWNKTFGGSDREWSHSILQTSDGGYSIIGGTRSFGAGDWDVWLIKTDSLGNEQWNNTYGGEGMDAGGWGEQTSDGGYIITGWTSSFGDINGDVWLIKTDALGNLQWQKTYGGALQENGHDVLQTSDNGFIITGDKHLGGNNDELWLIKTDSLGNIQWDRTFGGIFWEEGYSIQETTDGGYIIAGITSSFGNVKYDMWVIKTDSFGNEQWNKAFGGNNYDSAHSVIQTSDNGYIITGWTMSYGLGGKDVWLIKLEGSESPNQPPIGNVESDQVVNEGDTVLFDGSSSYDPDGTIDTYEWDFDINDGLWWETGAIQDATGPTPTHTYGDDGIYIVTLRVTDNDNLSATDTCNVTVQNVDPTVSIESVTMEVEIGLRVAGRKYNEVGMTLYEDGTPIGYVSVERMPGSPDDQMAWIPLSVDFSKPYTATITYTPEDPPNIGSNPVWIYLKSSNGSIIKIHHTFNVQQSKNRDSDHWNHIEPWEVDLNSHFVGLSFEITSHITDPGSDDEFLTYTYGSQIVNVTYLNNPPNLDPYPSPEVKPVDILDITTLIYEGPGTVILVVKDDDNVRLGIGEGNDSISVG